MYIGDIVRFNRLYYYTYALLTATCVGTCLDIYIYTYTLIVYTYTYIYICVCVSVLVLVFECTHMHIPRIRSDIIVMYACMLYVCMYVRTYACMHAFIRISDCAYLTHTDTLFRVMSK